MKIQEAAVRLGVTPRAIRFYEEKGLVSPRKETGNGYRVYEEDDIEKLRWVVALRELGLPLAAIADALETSADGERASLLTKLDAARAALFAEWRSATQALEAFDNAVSSWRQGNGTTELTRLEEAAIKLRDWRRLRESWQDRWHFDDLAAAHAQDAPLVHWGEYLGPSEYEQALRRAVEWLDPHEGEAGLDLAAGTGNLTALLHAAGARITAVEQSANMLFVYRSRFADAEAKLGNLLALPLTEAAYHFAGCTFALHHLEHNQQLGALMEIDRVLLPGGRLVIAGLSETSSGLHPIDYSSLSNELRGRSCKVAIERLNDKIVLLYAVKPN